MAENWANSPGPKPGSDRAVHMQKGIAMGMSAPASARKTKVPGMKGSTTGCAKVPGLYSG